MNPVRNAGPIPFTTVLFKVIKLDYENQVFNSFTILLWGVNHDQWNNQPESCSPAWEMFRLSLLFEIVVQTNL